MEPFSPLIRDIKQRPFQPAPPQHSSCLNAPFSLYYSTPLHMPPLSIHLLTYSLPRLYFLLSSFQQTPSIILPSWSTVQSTLSNVLSFLVYLSTCTPPSILASWVTFTSTISDIPSPGIRTGQPSPPHIFHSECTSRIPSASNFLFSLWITTM
jgi:hypothetical protein